MLQAGNRTAIRNLTRRDLIRLALALPAGAFLPSFHLFAAPLAGKVKITGIQAMGLDHIAGNCLIRIEGTNMEKVKRFKFEPV